MEHQQVYDEQLPQHPWHRLRLHSLIDVLHTLAYKGMNVFPGFDANLPTQLWIAARALQAVTLCVALLFLEKRVDKRAVFGVSGVSGLYARASSIAGIFPDCYVEGKGLTPSRSAADTY